MGTYIIQSDIENVFGKDNVARWSNLDGDTTVVTARITEAISYAEEDLDNRFRGGKYALPFSPVTSVIKNLAARIAGLWLFSNRPGFNRDQNTDEGFETMREVLDAEVEAYVSGQRKLLCSVTSSGYGKHPEGPTAV